ncbi:MAG: nitroreductase family protein [Acidimicrobiales bacterium]
MDFDLAQTDALLSTTRSVRKRLDLDRPVPHDVLLECIRLAVQAPTGGNAQSWRWLIVDDAETKAGLAELYARSGRAALGAYRRGTPTDQTNRVLDSADFLLEILDQVPTMVIPCTKGRLVDTSPVVASSFYGSIVPAVWSFQLALRSRGLGSCYTTLHLIHEDEAAELLGIPYDEVTQVALLPVAYTVGTDFTPAARGPVERITYRNRWKEPVAG